MANHSYQWLEGRLVKLMVASSIPGQATNF